MFKTVSVKSEPLQNGQSVPDGPMFSTLRKPAEFGCADEGPVPDDSSWSRWA
jgi:hypothetical protein